MGEAYATREQFEHLEKWLKAMVAGLFSLALVGAAALVVIGQYRERVDTTAKQVDTLTVTVNKMRSELAALKVGR